MTLLSQFSNTLIHLFPRGLPTKIAIAVSGGVDSLTLAHLLQRHIQKTNTSVDEKTRLVPITLNHQLRPTSSIEIPLIKSKLRNLGLHEEHIVRALDIPIDGDKFTSFEAIARRKRYECFSEICDSLDIQYLFLGHHLDDQIETYMMRLLGNSSIFGLSGMSTLSPSPYLTKNRLKLIRPLLNCSKSEIYEYALRNNIEWVQDHSNFENITKRNIIRNHLLSRPRDKDTSLQNLSQIQHTVKSIDYTIQEFYQYLCSSNLIHYDGYKYIIKFPLHLLNNTPDIVFIRFLYKLAYPISPTKKYYYHFNAMKARCGELQTKGTSTIASLQWTRTLIVKDGETYLQMIIERQTPHRPVSKELTIPPFSQSGEFLFDNVYWFNFRNLSSLEQKLTFRHLQESDKRIITGNIAPYDFKPKEFKNIPVVYDQNKKEVIALPTIIPCEHCEWMLKENIYQL